MEFIKQKIFWLFCISILIITGGTLWYFSSKAYFIPFSITYNQFDHPLIDAKFGTLTYPIEVRIGSRFPLFLNEETLNSIQKQPHETAKWCDLSGQSYEAPSYMIPEIKIGDLILNDMIAIQTKEKGANILGKYLGGEFNLLLDFSHSRIIACNSFSRIKRKNLADESWVKIPFKVSPLGIIFQVHTDLGILNLSLNTTSTATALKSSLIPSKDFTSSSFCIGKKEFGRVVFESLDLPDAFSGIDGFIGMDFLKNHAIYLDYLNKIAYVEPSPNYMRFPITFGNCGIPITNIQIEDKTHSLEIDFGSRFLFSLNEKILEGIKKTRYGNAEWSDFMGNKYQSTAFTLPEIKMGPLFFVDPLVVQDREDFHKNVTFNAIPEEHMGSIGRLILEKYNLFLDFRNSSLYAANDYLHLQEAGFLSRDLLAIPFILHHDGILLSVETDSGHFQLLLDTGATCTVIRTPHARSTSRFCLMDHDFGPRSILPLAVNSRFEHDGYLGMDFLREYSLFIDYSKKLIFIDLQSLKETKIH